MKITRMDREAAGVVRREVDAALRKIGLELGLDLSIGNIKFDALGLRTTLTAKMPAVATSVASVAGVPATWTVMARQMAGHKGYHDGWARVSSLGECRIVDYNSRAPKMPWIVETRSGKKWKLRHHQMAVFGVTPAAPALGPIFNGVPKTIVEQMLADSLAKPGEDPDFDPGDDFTFTEQPQSDEERQAHADRYKGEF